MLIKNKGLKSTLSKLELSEECIDLMCLMLSYEQNERPKLEQLMQHKWLKSKVN